MSKADSTHHQRARQAAIQELGGACAYCGIDDPIVLNIDHVHNDGAADRRKLNHYQLCSKIANGTLSKDRYQLLCCNCNWRKEYLRRTGNFFLPPLADKRLNQNDKKTACIHGHPFDERNTYVRVDGTRMCKACNAEAQKRYAKQKSGTSPPHESSESRVPAVRQTH